MTVREQILDTVRQSLGRGTLTQAQLDTLRDRTPAPESGVRPRFDQDPVERFIEKLISAAGTLDRVGSQEDIPTAIGRYLDKHALPPNVVMSSEEIMDGVAWPPEWTIANRAATGEDLVSVTGAFSAIAETGSVVRLSGADSPTTHSFLPDDHIVVLSKKQVVSHIEDVWWLLQKSSPDMPRTVNIITGPSRTADVEQTIQLGAHGPRRLHVILVDD